MELNFNASIDSFLVDKWWDTKETGGFVGVLIFILAVCFFMEFLNWCHDQIRTHKKKIINADTI